MNRQQKEAVVAHLHDAFRNSSAVFLVNYQGLNVDQMQQLRQKIRESDATLRVAKARLMKIATQDIAGADSFREQLKDQVGLIFASNEPSSVASAIMQFAKGHDALKVVAGFFESGMLSKEQVTFLASIPPKEVLYAQFVGTLQAPIANLVGVLRMMLIRLLVVLKEIEKKKQG